MSNKKIAVTTPCWNMARFLPRFLQALQQLQLESLDIVWVFAYAPSKDETLRLLKEAKLPFKVHIVSKKDVEDTDGNDKYKNMAEARNTAYKFIRKAYGDGYFDFLSTVDADVIIPPNFFTSLLPHFENEDVGAVCAHCLLEKEFLRKVHEGKATLKEEVKKVSVCTTAAAIFRENVFDYFDTRFYRGADLDLALTVGEKGYIILGVSVAALHLRPVPLMKSLTTDGYKKGYYTALLWTKHPRVCKNPYTILVTLLYWGIIVNLPLCVLFLLGTVPWWAGIWSIVGLVVAFGFQLRTVRGVKYRLYELVRALTRYFGSLCGFPRFTIPFLAKKFLFRKFD